MIAWDFFFLTTWYWGSTDGVDRDVLGTNVAVISSSTVAYAADARTYIHGKHFNCPCKYTLCRESVVPLWLRRWVPRFDEEESERYEACVIWGVLLVTHAWNPSTFSNGS